MPSDDTTSPPGYAWDWLARQRLVWIEAARRLAVPAGPPARSHPEFPDWSGLLDAAGGAARSRASRAGRDGVGTLDWALLDTRADVVAALRSTYPTDAAVRRATDGAVTELAFLGRLDVPLEARGVRSVPRGMRWWWTHLGGVAGHAASRDSSVPDPVDEPARAIPLQLRLADVLDGYGDAEVASRSAGRMDR